RAARVCSSSASTYQPPSAANTVPTPASHKNRRRSSRRRAASPASGEYSGGSVMLCSWATARLDLRLRPRIVGQDRPVNSKLARAADDRLLAARQIEAVDAEAVAAVGLRLEVLDGSQQLAVGRVEHMHPSDLAPAVDVGGRRADQDHLRRLAAEF